MMLSFSKGLPRILMLVFLCVLPGIAKEKTELSGRFGAGMLYREEYVYGASYYYGRIKIETRLDKDIETVLDFRGRSESNEVTLKGGFLRLNCSSYGKVKIGQIKKRFGVEEMVHRDDLLTIEPSLLNRHLEPFGFVVRGLGVSVYRKYKGKGLPLAYSTGLYYNESHHAYVLLRADWHQMRWIDKAGAGIVYRKPTGLTQQSVFALSVDAKKQWKTVSAEVEGMYGQDPVETEYRAFDGSGGKAFFCGARLQLSSQQSMAYRFWTAWEPVLLVSYLMPDLWMKRRYIAFNVCWD